ncbi:nudix-type nucleoside diphosphatase, YffH/AdpP family [Loktanella atrilutea]|uniref:Putative gamma-glutamylcyclotransferase n=1 Tax=Loktanella atrilutea TaxID=366533 RepID=A0A1M4V8Y6_LOKAT|nr:NUDIX domain-containing protein [Loktanella atrilutea]SHE65392.1 nudix-type nucleoside diphosphatase, YffH/AdpP family [Loktanella atrilutea]
MDVFVYGTLRDPALRQAVAGDAGHVTPAILRGHAVRPVADDVIPMIVSQSDAVATGLLWRDLTPDQMDRLALYEGAHDYALITVTVALPDGTDAEALMWQPPATLMAAPGEWSFEVWQVRCGTVCVAAATEIFAQETRPSPANLRWQYPVMLKRAWARHLAAMDRRPADLRHAAGPGDVSVANRAAPLGRFFRLQGFDVTHSRFDGGRQGPLPREVMVGVDAVMVMPYDPVRDRVVLVEQIRMGVLERGDPNPWMLEPVAGMIDAFETPTDSALRETREEAGLDVTLRHVTSHYPSPGNATDYFHCFVGFCDLPDLQRYTGGLDSEHEDLALHVLTLDQALGHVASGEIAVGPGITLLYWLALNRDALRLEFAGAAP